MLIQAIFSNLNEDAKKNINISAKQNSKTWYETILQMVPLFNKELTVKINLNS